MLQAEKKSSVDAQNASEGSPAADHLLRLVDAGLISVLFLAPLIMGGRHAAGRLVLVALILGTVVSWLARQAVLRSARWRFSGGEIFLLLGVALLGLQLVPLPAAVWESVSPGMHRLLGSSAEDGSPALGAWRQISVMPEATRVNLMMFTSISLLFLIAVQRLETFADVDRLLKWIAAAAVFMAALGGLQYLLSNGKFLWIYQHPSRDTLFPVKGSFANQNHFAHFLALGLPALICWLHQLWSSPQRSRASVRGFAATGRTAEDWRRLGKAALLGCLAIVCVAGLLSVSRGGIFALLLAALGTVALATWRGIFSQRVLWGLAAAAVLIGVGVSWHGYEKIVARFQTVKIDEIDRIGEQTGRQEIWAANLTAVQANPLMGGGSGSHIEVYPTHYREPRDVEYTHAENGYLQVATENGAAGLLLLLAAIGLVGSWCWKAFRRAPTADFQLAAIAVAAALIVSLVHSIVDFVWFIPACLTVTILLAACACRLSHLTATAEESPTHAAGTFSLARPLWCAAAATVSALGAVALASLVHHASAARHWDAYLRISLADRATGTDDDPEAAAGRRAARIDAMVSHLRRGLDWNPRDARMHVRLASLCLLKFETAQLQSENRMTLSDVRGAARASNFASLESQNAWLDRALGENRPLLDHAQRHARAALQHCPLIGRAYVHLSDLAFLTGADSKAPALLARAASLRPHDPVVLFAQGRHAALSGDVKTAIARWRRAFHMGREFQQPILAALAPQMSTQAIVETFAPDRTGVYLLMRQMQGLGREQETAQAAKHYIAAVEREAPQLRRSLAVRVWRRAATAGMLLGDNEAAAKFAEKSLQIDPNQYSTRWLIAHLLVRVERFDEALVHLNWCRRRRPDDQKVAQAITALERRRLQANLRTTERSTTETR